MGKYITSIRIPRCFPPLSFLLPETRGTVHLFCGENSVGKSYILSKMESLYRGISESGFEIETVVKDDSLSSDVSLYYGKIWKQKDRCASFHFTNTKKKDIAPTDGPVELYSNTLRFIYECAFPNAVIPIDTFADLSKWEERLNLVKDVEADATTCFPCPAEHPLVKAFESIVEGYRLYYQFFHEKKDEICFEYVLVTPDGYISTQSKWSDGQKTVFYLLLNLYYQKSSVVILDELENHMHPFYISKVLDIIRQSGRQCFLSTHHPHVIFSEYVDKVFYVELVKNGSFPIERYPIKNVPSKRAFHRKVYELETDFEMITNTYKLFDIRDAQLLKLSRYYQNEIELKAYEIISRIRTSNSPVGVGKSSLPDKQSQLLEKKVGNERILDIGAGYGRIRDELNKNVHIDAEWFLFNPDITQHEKIKDKFEGVDKIYPINRYDEVDDNSIDVVIVSNVIHEITPPALRDLLIEAEKKLNDSGRLFIIDMEPLLYTEHYAVPYTYSEIETILNNNGWVCNHDVVPHKFVTLYVVTAEKIDSMIGSYDIEELWNSKLRNALAVYRTARGNCIGDYQKTMQAMTTVCSIESFISGIWK